MLLTNKPNPTSLSFTQLGTTIMGISNRRHTGPYPGDNAAVWDTKTKQWIQPTFTRFPFLPAEIRIKIWKLATNDDSLIGPDSFTCTKRNEIFLLSTALPGVLLASRESRQVASQFFKHATPLPTTTLRCFM